jgi:integrase
MERLEKENKHFEGDLGLARAVSIGKAKVEATARDEGTTKYLLPEHFPSILSRYGFVLLQGDEEDRKGLALNGRARHIAYLEEWIDCYRDCCARDDFSPIEEVADALLAAERLIAPPGSEVRKAFLSELMEKDIELAEIQFARAKGKIHRNLPSLPVAPRDLPTMMSLYEAWAKGQDQVRTRDAYFRFVEEFESLFRALPVIAIDHKKHGLGYRDYLAGCELYRRTVGNRIGGLATLVRFGMSDGLIDKGPNPFELISLKGIPDKPAYLQRRSYDSAELSRIFHSSLYAGAEQADGQCAEVAFWGPLMGAFAGPRIEELCQLRIDDIRRINGEWALRIANLDPQQHLKTRGSYRFVPMHKELIACGLLSFAAQQKRAGHQRLFPSLTNDNKYRRYSNAYGKWHSRFLDRIGVDDGRVCFHSYRYSFKQQLGICKVGHEASDALTGHWLEKKSPGKVYMRAADEQYPFPILVDAIRSLRYDEVKLSHLHVSNPLVGVIEALG